jgi:hypothetical protein
LAERLAQAARTQSDFSLVQSSDRTAKHCLYNFLPIL